MRDPTTNSVMWCQKMALASAALLNCYPSWLAFTVNRTQRIRSYCLVCQLIWEPPLPSAFAGVRNRGRAKALWMLGWGISHAAMRLLVLLSEEGTPAVLPPACLEPGESCSGPRLAHRLVMQSSRQKAVWFLRSTCLLGCSCAWLYCSQLNLLSLPFKVREVGPCLPSRRQG